MDWYSEETFYLVGALRDGSVYKYEKTRNYCIVWYSANKAFLERVICSKLKKLGFAKCKPYMYKQNHYRVRIYSKKLYDVMVKTFEHPVNNDGRKIPWPTPKIIKEAPLRYQLEYVKGFVDAEGSIIRSDKGVQIDISQMIKEPLEFIKHVLSLTGISVTGIYLGSDNVWRLRIASKDGILKFHAFIGFRHPCKRRRLMELIQAYNL